MKLNDDESLVYDGAIKRLHIIITRKQEKIILRIGLFDGDCSSKKIAQFELTDEEFYTLGDVFTNSCRSIRKFRHQTKGLENFEVQEVEVEGKKKIRFTGKKDFIANLIGLRL